MIRRLITGLAVAACVLALLVVSFWAWGLRVPKPPMPHLEGKLRSSSLTVDGRRRTFVFYVPPRLRPNPPLLLVLHASMMNGEHMRAITGYAFDEIADREGFLVAYPNGYGGYWNDCRSVADYDAKRLAINDVAFLRTLTDWFRGRYNIATNAVFAVGASNGGSMIYRLGLEAPDLVRGIAAISANLPAAENQTCVPSGRPVATMIVNGTDDPIVPYGGGRVALFRIFLRRGNVQSAVATATYWANLAGHRAPPAVEDLPDNDPTDGATATRYRWSSVNRPSVVLLAIHGGGHTIPHPIVRGARLLGHTCHDFSAPREIWDFFAAESHRAHEEHARSRDQSGQAIGRRWRT
jgi:polyhydroxybutyrate depolymerase